MYKETRYLPSGDKGITVEFGNQINEEINQKVRFMATAIKNHSIQGIEAIIPTYRSILVQYDPLIIFYEDLVKELMNLEQHLNDSVLDQASIIKVPVLYGGESGPDLDFVADHAGLTTEEVIEIHSGTTYLIYMLGFTPGFPYLGGMDERIKTPRLQTPRTKIPAGSVGIAGSQTGIYSIDSPGGWQLIGKTPLILFDRKKKEQPFLFQQGDRIQFVPISPDIYKEIEMKAVRGSY